ncbi:hypothetical protein RFI_04959 [Reticulomyxa filosa]|uniref:Uncharacterized protein n=1 Tax=Reticulomyxa filosa TaxID=46433 RepID=X6P3K8_RETFI|nr:hypothetical protein RFI_04959 [Reticulomyxa filosa]|eukprot:ETO32157.1 hypothetical protein RFI_04959 [Reticulomyxa filosa]
MEKKNFLVILLKLCIFAKSKDQSFNFECNWLQKMDYLWDNEVLQSFLDANFKKEEWPEATRYIALIGLQSLFEQFHISKEEHLQLSLSQLSQIGIYHLFLYVSYPCTGVNKTASDRQIKTTPTKSLKDLGKHLEEIRDQLDSLRSDIQVNAPRICSTSNVGGETEQKCFQNTKKNPHVGKSVDDIYVHHLQKCGKSKGNTIEKSRSSFNVSQQKSMTDEHATGIKKKKKLPHSAIYPHWWPQLEDVSSDSDTPIKATHQVKHASTKHKGRGVHQPPLKNANDNKKNSNNAVPKKLKKICSKYKQCNISCSIQTYMFMYMYVQIISGNNAKILLSYTKYQLKIIVSFFFKEDCVQDFYLKKIDKRLSQNSSSGCLNQKCNDLKQLQAKKQKKNGLGNENMANWINHKWVGTYQAAKKPRLPLYNPSNKHLKNVPSKIKDQIVKDKSDFKKKLENERLAKTLARYGISDEKVLLQDNLQNKNDEISVSDLINKVYQSNIGSLLSFDLANATDTPDAKLFAEDESANLLSSAIDNQDEVMLIFFCLYLQALENQNNVGIFEKSSECTSKTFCYFIKTSKIDLKESQVTEFDD